MSALQPCSFTPSPKSRWSNSSLVARFVVTHAELLHQALAGSVVTEEALDLLAELREVPERSLERGQRVPKLHQLAQLRDLLRDALRREVLHRLEVEADGHLGLVVPRQLVRDVHAEAE